MAGKRGFYTIASQKGGVGKTTTAVNLAACMRLLGKETLLIDLDPQGNATSGVGIERAERSFLRHCLLENRPVSSVVRESAFAGLYVLPSAAELAEVKLHAEIEAGRQKSFQRLMGRIGERFEVVIVDCPPSRGLLPELSFWVAEEVIVPVQCEYYAMEGLSQILPQVKEAQKNVNPKLKVGGLLLTMFDSELEFSREVDHEVRSYFGDLVYGTSIPRDVTLAESASHGQPIVAYDIISRGGWAYICFTKEVLRNGNS